MKFLIKKSPDNFIQSVNDEISSILNRNFDNFFPEYVYNDDMYKCAMPVEIDEKDKEYLVKAELPGVKKEDLDIDLEKNRLTISAKREEEHKEDTKGFRKSEFKYGEFSRTVYFPDEIDIEKTSAKLEHGILRIEAPKIAVEKTGIGDVWNMVLDYVEYTKKTGYFEHKRIQQSRYWMQESINNALLGHFYQNEAIATALHEAEDKVLRNEVSSFVAANRILEDYFKSTFEQE